ncbi:MAG: hypothetical protein LBF71_05500 [Campylobacteraceae bacterium]|jgi:hypothetical protein|nr:hypothetical protein [Campylobacteraceae bacterium]
MAGNINSGRKIKDERKMSRTFSIKESTLTTVMKIALKLNITENEVVGKALQIYTETLQKIFNENRDELL